MALKRNKNGTFTVKTKAEAEEALTELDRIQTEIGPKMIEAAELKKAATAFAEKKNVDVVQLDGAYYRLITRNTRMWIATDDDMPQGVKGGAKSLQSIVKGIKIGKKPLWQLITKRVPDPELIDEAVRQGWISEKKIGKAFIEKPQNPFLQRYEGVAADE